MFEDSIDRSIIGLVQGDLPLQSHPFLDLAQDLGISEAEIVARVRSLQGQGILRRWGAVLRHRQAGFVANAMVAWKVEAERADELGQALAEFKEISHCYLREVPDEFAYNLFTMLHARTEEELEEILSRTSLRTGLQDYLVIKSLKELKKASMQYV
ncbi:MAG: Lrp/AsnC family transcriptional regulator [Firmicutes bacterium]|nr:Lrp/AsnC family transcriptional regulator [Bacillota bacterium]